MDDELAATGGEESDPGYLRNEELRKIFGKSEPTLERAQALWDRAYEQATRNAENGQKNTAREGGARFLAEYDPETASIKGQIENTRKTLNQIELVVSLAIPQNLKSKSEASRWVIEILKPTGYQVERKDYGTIFFSKKDIDKGLRYADRVEERAAIAARPNVLKMGKEGIWLLW